MITAKYLIYTFLKCLICTIIIECIFAFILKVRNKKDYLNIILVNVLTNPLLNAILIYINIFISLKARRIAVYPLEILVVIIEGFIYKKCTTFKKPYLMSLLLNGFSYTLGLIINLII